MYFAVATDKAECAFLLLTCMFFYTHSALYMYVVCLSTLFDYEIMYHQLHLSGCYISMFCSCHVDYF